MALNSGPHNARLWRHQNSELGIGDVAVTGGPSRSSNDVKSALLSHSQSLPSLHGVDCSMQQQQAATDPFAHFNARNAKLISLVCVLIVTLYHSLLKISYGEDLCVGLLETGRYQGEHIWQPYGCMLHTYSQSDSRMCTKYNFFWGRSNVIAFVGDARIRQLYETFVAQLDPEKSSKTPLAAADGTATPLSNTNVNNHFIDVELNLTVEYFEHLRIDKSVMQRFEDFSQHALRPNLVVVGAGAQSISEGNGSALEAIEYATNTSYLLPFVQQMRSTTRFLWVVQPPVFVPNSHPLYANVTNGQLDAFNDAAKEILAYTSMKIWESMRLLSLGFGKDTPDGYLVGPVALNYATQILFNLYCNDLMNYPDGTCCSHDEPVATIQAIAFVVFLISVVLGALVMCSACGRRRRLRAQQRQLLLAEGDDDSAQNSGQPVSNTSSCTRETTFAWTKICLVLVFCFVCDRTGMYMKENKWFTLFNFFLPIGYLGVLGLFFNEETKKTCFMHGEQMDELRGLAQLVILVYNMTGASKVLWTYMLNHCIISCLLFLAGYSHFVYFWTTGDFSLKRLFKVLFKYNFMVVLLCVTMNRPYQFYEFVPLLSYWFFVIYLTMALPPQISAASSEANPLHYFYLIVKFLILFAAISMLFLSEVFFEKVFLMRPWKALFSGLDDSVQGWWLRWWLHRYSAASGAVFGFLVVLLRRYMILVDSQASNLFSRRLTFTVALASIVGLSVYAVVMAQCRTQAECTEVHAYISVVPILSFLTLRNVFGRVRVRVSTLFAWFGRLWIELIVTQYHVWLAADAHGVLVLFPRWPVFNVILTSFLLVCVAHEVRLIALRLLPLFVPDDEPHILMRNVLVLFAVALPLGFLYGML